MPCSPHWFEAHITRCSWRHILVALVTLISIILHTITNEGAFQCETAVTNVAFIKIPCYHIPFHIIEVNQVHHKVNNSTIWEENYYPETAFSMKNFSSAHMAGVISMGFLEYVIKRSTAIWFKGISLYFRSRWQFCWIWPWKQKPFRHK